MGYWGSWKPYVSVAERRRKAEKAAAKARQGGASLTPIAPYRGAIAKTFWGKAWCDNLERYSDFANRLPRGRTYVRNGSVIDLKIAAGSVQATVVGSSLYQVVVTVASVPDKQWRAIRADCANSIDSLVELLQGRLSKAVMERICKPGGGLFPTPEAIKFSCSCPDWAAMCKHVAAVLYGVGARLDHQPELLFSLRQVDAQALVALPAGAGLGANALAGPAAAKVLADAELAAVFGIEMAERAPATARAKRKGRSLDETPAVASRAKAKVRAKRKPTTANVAKTARKTAKSLPQPAATAKAAGKLAAKTPTGKRKTAAGVPAGSAKTTANAKDRTVQPKPSPARVRSRT
jgi:uncharacterized Zn finger protein